MRRSSVNLGWPAAASNAPDALPEPVGVHTCEQLAQALKALAGGRGPRDIETAARKLTPPERLAKQTVSDMLSKGRPSERTLAVFLRVCDVPRTRQTAWESARRRAVGRDGEPDLQRLFDLARVGDANPADLGVHAAIDVSGSAGDLPMYVERDTDTDPVGVRALIQKAVVSGRGRLVLLVGESSAGKTRCACEAIQRLVPHWWLLQPADVEQIRQAAAHPPAELVVWLDDLQKYLNGTTGLTPNLVRTLTGRGVLLVATMREEFFRTYAHQPGAADSRSYSAEWEVVKKQASAVTIRAKLSNAEKARAQVAASRDRHIAAGLRITGYELFPAIAAAPALARHADGADPYARAVLQAAVDAARLGVRSPLSGELLRQAAPGYCNARQRGAAPGNWFEAAMAYLTQKLNNAAAVLDPIASPGTMAAPKGYLVADYLQQKIGQQLRPTKVPASTWRALIEHPTTPEDQVRAAEAAMARLLYGCAERLLKQALAAGGEAAERLARLLAEQGRVDDLRTLVETGNANAAWRLAKLLVKQRRADDLRALADAGDAYARWRLADLLAEQGRVDDLRALVETGDAYARWRLADLLVKQGRVDDLRALVETGDAYARWRLADLLAEQGRVDDLRALTETGDAYAAQRLADLLAEQGRVDDLRALVDAGDAYAAERLADLLAKQGQTKEAIAVLRVLAGTGNTNAAWRLADLLAEQGRMGELRALADTGDTDAAWRLAALLAEQGESDELRALADTGNTDAAWRLADLLAEQGRSGDLRALADTGDAYAAWRLAALLTEQGESDELRALADTGNTDAAWRLAVLLAEQGRSDELRALADTGNTDAAWRLADLLAKQGRTDDLRALAGTSNANLAMRLASLLAKQGRTDDLRALADSGDAYAAERLADLLAKQSRSDDLRALVDTGNAYAAMRLTTLLDRQGRRKEAEQIRRFGLQLEDDA